MNHIRLCVFPTDPLAATIKKGEIKKRYWNPGNAFSEIHVVDFSDEPISVDHIQPAAGAARLIIHRLRRPSIPSLLATTARVQNILARIQPDVVRAFSPNWVGFVATKASKRLHIPVVVSIHGNFDETRTGLKGRISSWLEDYALSNASAVVCMTAFLREYAHRHHAKNVHVIYNKIYTRDFNPHATNKRAGLLWVGRLDEPKRPELAIAAASKTRQTITIIGDGRKKSELEALAKNAAAPVQFIPSVPHSRITSHYQKAKILVMTSDSEGFCIPVLEAMAAGLPVVASDIPAIAEVAGGAAVLVPNTPKAVTRGVQALLQDPRLWKKMQRKGLTRAKALDGTRIETKERKLYEELAKARDI